MLIANLLSPSSIVQLNSQTKEGVIEELIAVLNLDERRRKEAIKALLEREGLGSTGLGDGVAIPHGTIKGIEHILLALGRSSRGVDFRADDGKPVHIFFLLLAPEGKADFHLRALAKICNMMKDEKFRRALLSARGAEEIYHLIKVKDEEL